MDAGRCRLDVNVSPVSGDRICGGGSIASPSAPRAHALRSIGYASPASGYAVLFARQGICARTHQAFECTRHGRSVETLSGRNRAVRGVEFCTGGGATFTMHQRRRQESFRPPPMSGPSGSRWSRFSLKICRSRTNPRRPDPTPPETVPEPFRGIARECLHLDPKRRCSLADIQARLQPAARSVPADPVATLTLHRTVKRGPVAAALLVGAVLVGSIFFISHGKSGPSPVSSRASNPPIKHPQRPRRCLPIPNPHRPGPLHPNHRRWLQKTTAVGGGVVVHQVLPEVLKVAQHNHRYGQSWSAGASGCDRQSD